MDEVLALPSEVHSLMATRTLPPLAGVKWVCTEADASS